MGNSIIVKAVIIFWLDKPQNNNQVVATCLFDLGLQLDHNQKHAP